MVNMGTENMLEQLSRRSPDSQQTVQWAWCLHKWDSRKILKVSEKACEAVPGLTVLIIPEPISWFDRAIDPYTGGPVLVPAWRRRLWGLYWSGYTCQIRGTARQLQDYLRLMRDGLDAN